MRVAIIGAGLAGCAAANIIKRNGSHPILFEAEGAIAQGASGNPLGLVNPRFYAHKTPESEYYAQAFLGAVEFFDVLGAEENNAIGWQKCGALHLITDEKKRKRFPQTCVNWGWPPEQMRIVGAREASDIANVDIAHDALYLRDSGSLNPKALCEFMARDVEIRTGQLVSTLADIADIKADYVVIACAAAARQFAETAFLPLKTVRGQITQITSTQNSGRLRCNVHYGGYCAPERGGIHTIGATFQPWLAHSDLIPQDDADNIAMLLAAMPDLAGGADMKVDGAFEIKGSRAAVRCTLKDHLPVAGNLPSFPRVYVSLAHGSHGIISALAAAQIIAADITGTACRFSAETRRAVSPARFL